MAMAGVVVPGSVSGDETTETVVVGAGGRGRRDALPVSSRRGASCQGRRDVATITSAPIRARHRDPADNGSP